MKMLETSAPIDVLVGNATFSDHDIVHDECLSNIDIVLAGMFEFKDVKCELVQVT